MKFKTILATATLATGAITLPAMAETWTIPWTNNIGSYSYSWAGCTWNKVYENGAFGTAYYYYKPVGACSYRSLNITNPGGGYATLTAN